MATTDEDEELLQDWQDKLMIAERMAGKLADKLDAMCEYYEQLYFEGALEKLYTTCCLEMENTNRYVCLPDCPREHRDEAYKVFSQLSLARATTSRAKVMGYNAYLAIADGGGTGKSMWVLKALMCTLLPPKSHIRSNGTTLVDPERSIILNLLWAEQMRKVVS